MMLGNVPDLPASVVNYQVPVPPSQPTTPWWQQVGTFLDKATNVFNAAKPVVQQGQSFVDSFRNTSQNNPAFNYGTTNTPGSAPTQRNNTGLIVGVLAAVTLAGGIYLATRPKKKGVNGLGCACDTVDAEAQVVSTAPLNGVKKRKRKKRK